jgi:outer membrane protein
VKVKTLSIVAATMLSVASFSAAAQSKIGFVDSDKIMREAQPAVQAQERLEREFSQRDDELQRMARELQSMQEELERDALTMSDSDRQSKEREFNNLSRDFQRKQREFREDLNQRRNEELSSVLERANAAIEQVAESENYDIILQEAVYASPGIDITDRVIQRLEN